MIFMKFRMKFLPLEPVNNTNMAAVRASEAKLLPIKTS